MVKNHFSLMDPFQIMQKRDEPMARRIGKSRALKVPVRKQPRKALEEGEERYRRIFENSKYMVYMTSADGKLLDINQAGLDLLGFGSKEEVTPIYAGDTFLNAEDQKRFMNEVIKAGFIKDFEVKLKKRDGTPVDVLITANVRRDDSGKIISYDGIIKDISDRKSVEEELVRRTKELEALNEMGVLINQSLDLEKVFHVALEKAVSLTGFEMASIFLVNEERKILERKFQKGNPPKMLEDGEVLKYGEGVSGRAIILKKPVIASINEYSSYRKAPVLIEEGIQTLVGFPLLSKGKAIGTITLLSHSRRELSQREINLLESIGSQIGVTLENAKLFSIVEKAKSEWETTFDAVTNGIIIIDRNYRILRVNKHTLKRFGVGFKDLIGKKCFEALEHRDKLCERCSVSDVFTTKKSAFLEKENKYTKRLFQLRAFPIFNEAREVVGAVELANDITEEKRLEIEKEVVNNVNKILASSLDVKEMIKAVRAELNRVLDSERMSIALFDEKEEGFRFFALERDYDGKILVGDALYPRKGTHFEKVAKTGLPEVIKNIAETDSWIGQKLLEEGIRSSLAFPLEYQGNIIGTMNFGSRKTNHFSESQFGLLQQIAPGLAISIQNTLLFEETKKRLDELTILYEIAKISTSASLNKDQMLGEIVESLTNLFKFEYLGIFLVEENTRRLIPHISYKSHPHPIEYIKGLGLCLGKGITGWVAEKGEPLLVNDVREDARYLCADEDIRSEVCVPLKMGQKVIGVIDAQSKELNVFSEDDLRMLDIAAGQIAAVIENVRLQEKISQSEEQYRTVVEGALDGVCVIGGDYRLKYVNERYAEIRGCSRQELIGTDFRDYLDEEGKRLLAYREDQQNKGIKLSPCLELNIVRNDGEVRNTEISRTIRDSEGDIKVILFVRDITDRKRAEEALRKEKETVQKYLDIAGVMLIVINADQKVTLINRKGCEILGYKEEEIIGKNWFDNFLPEGVRNKVKAIFSKLVAGEIEPVGYFENTVLTKRGEERIIAWHNTVITDENGNIAGTLSSGEDITERKQAEEALKRSEETARQLSQENAIIAEIGRIISSTLNIEEVYGRFAEEVCKVIPFDRVSVNVINPDRTSITIAYAFGIKVGDINEGDVLPLDAPFNENIVSRRQGVLIQPEDESELAEGYPHLVPHFRTGIRSMMTAPLISKDQVIGLLHFQSLKRNSYTELGLRLAEKVGNQIASAIANAQLYSERKQAEEALKRNQEELIKKNKEIEESRKNLQLAVEELERAYKELKATQSKILQQEKMASIGQLAAGVAHEINNPMAFISSNLGTLGKYVHRLTEFIQTQSEVMESLNTSDAAEGLKRKQKELKLDYITEDIKGLIAESLDGSERVLKIVQGLKSFSRVDEAEYKYANINECIESALNIVWNELKYKATLKKDYGNLPLTKCYPQQMNQVFMNLLVNAGDAIEKQGEITIKTWDEDGSIIIAISDTGGGIPQENLNKIFEPFFTTKEVGKGTGLGLSITYEIVQRHNGEITVESEVKKGTTFTIRIPIV